MSDGRICGTKLMQDWVPSGQSLFCNKPLGHDGQHAWRSEWQTLPTQQEQQAIDRSLANEIGQALGRIELKLRNMADDGDKDHQLYRHMNEKVCETHNAQLNIANGINDLAARLDERLGAIEKHLASQDIRWARHFDALLPKPKAQRRQRRSKR